MVLFGEVLTYLSRDLSCMSFFEDALRDELAFRANRESRNRVLWMQKKSLGR